MMWILFNLLTFFRGKDIIEWHYVCLSVSAIACVLPESFPAHSISFILWKIFKSICQMVINLGINYSDSRSMSQLKVMKFNLYNHVRYISSAPLWKIFNKRLSHAHLIPLLPLFHTCPEFHELTRIDKYLDSWLNRTQFVKLYKKAHTCTCFGASVPKWMFLVKQQLRFSYDVQECLRNLVWITYDFSNRGIRGQSFEQFRTFEPNSR